VNTKRAGEQYERQVIQALLDGTWNDGKEEDQTEKEIPTLDEFADEFLATYVKSNNSAWEIRAKEGHLKRYLRPELGHLKLDEIGVREVEVLKSKLLGGELHKKKKLKKKSVNNVLGTFGKLMRYAEEMEIIIKVPRIRFLKVPAPQFDFLTFDEAERLLEAAKHNPLLYALIFVALRTGLRWGELCELRWTDIDLKVGRLVVNRAFGLNEVKAPKSGKGREVPLSPQTIAVLKDHRHLRGELVFSDEKGSRLDYHQTDEKLKGICRRAGLRNFRWHGLRHTFASHLVMRGRSIKEVQELLGHSTISMTQRYAHLSPSVKRDAVAVLDAPALSAGQSQGNEQAQ
jgi:integrase